MTVDVNIVSDQTNGSGGGGGNSSTPSNTIPQMSSGGFINAAIAAAATSPVAFSNQACKQLTVANNDPTNTLWVTQDLGNPSFPVFPQSYFTLFGLTNANQVTTTYNGANTAATTVAARWEA